MENKEITQTVWQVALVANSSRNDTGVKYGQWIDVTNWKGEIMYSMPLFLGNDITRPELVYYVQGRKVVAAGPILAAIKFANWLLLGLDEHTLWSE